VHRLRTLLAAIDLSSAAQQAASRAAQIASEHSAELALVHVVETDWLLAVRDLVGDRDLHGAYEEQRRIQLSALAADIARQQGIQPQVLLRSGSPLKELSEAAKSADLMVIAAGGHPGVRGVALGSTPSRLARLVSRPLLVVRNPVEHAYRRVLVATDFSDASVEALRHAIRLAPTAHIDVVHCFQMAYESRLRLAGAGDEQLQAYRDHARAVAERQAQGLPAQVGDPARVRVSIRQGDARFELLAAAKQYGTDLIVVGKQGRSFVSETLLGSVTAWLLEEASCDVLVVPSV
jgi:nucleotide-binding universal stress UspA family protein